LDPDRLPDFQVDLPSSNSGRADGDRGFVLADLSATIVRKLSVPYNLASALLVEGLMMLWLLVMTFPKWEEKASSSTNHA
jgi:hypothetical protein